MVVPRAKLTNMVVTAETGCSDAESPIFLEEHQEDGQVQRACKLVPTCFEDVLRLGLCQTPPYFGTWAPDTKLRRGGFCASMYKSSSPLMSGCQCWTTHRQTKHMLRAQQGKGRRGRTYLRGCPITLKGAWWEKSELSWISLPFCLSWDGLMVFTLKDIHRWEVQ